MPVAICKSEDKIINARVAKLYVYDGLKRVEVEHADAGDIVALSGVADINIGDTICDYNNPEKIPFIDIDEPTVSMTFSVNNGPFAGKEGQFITSRHIRDRLFKELDRNVSLRVKETDRAEAFEVSGRGELHLGILIERYGKGLCCKLLLAQTDENKKTRSEIIKAFNKKDSPEWKTLDNDTKFITEEDLEKSDMNALEQEYVNKKINRILKKYKEENIHILNDVKKAFPLMKKLSEKTEIKI